MNEEWIRFGDVHLNLPRGEYRILSERVYNYVAADGSVVDKHPDKIPQGPMPIFTSRAEAEEAIALYLLKRSATP